MYFKSRAHAGRKLAAKMKKYANQPCAVVALNSGGILVGAQIALKLRAHLSMLINDTIVLPGEHEPIASMTTSTFTFNSAFSAGEIEDLSSEYRGLIDAQRIAKMRKLNMLLSDGGEIDIRSLKNHTVILVADALQTPMPLEVAADFLKPINIEKLIIATPLATPATVDQMRLMGDEIFALSVGDNLMDSDHYYDDNVIPNHQDAMKIIRNISMTWNFKVPK